MEVMHMVEEEGWPLKVESQNFQDPVLAKPES